MTQAVFETAVSVPLPQKADPIAKAAAMPPLSCPNLCFKRLFYTLFAKMLDNSVLFDYNLVRIFKKYSKFVITPDSRSEGGN